MAVDFHGTIEALEAAVAQAAVGAGEWIPIEHGHQFRGRDGATINWYTKRGNLVFGGPAQARMRMEERLTALLVDGELPPKGDGDIRLAPAPVKANAKKVFVVHGHDVVAREQLELLLHKLGLEPFVLMNTGGGGRTIIEALEEEIGHPVDGARFGIVLMTPDDIGYARAEGETKAEPRPRQNVVLEMGMLIQAIGKKNVAILKKGHLEPPSDAQGIIYLAFNEHVKEVASKLVDRLRGSGFDISPEKITAAGS